MKTQTQFINTDKALRHLVKKFQGCSDSNKPFKISDYDILCLNNIVDYVERDRAKKPYVHSMFSKLFIFLYWQLLIKYNTTVTDNIVQRNLGAILRLPLDNHVMDFMNFINSHERSLFIKDIGLNDGLHPAISDSKKQMNIINSLSPEQKKRLTQNNWDFDSVKYFLSQMITNALNIFSDDSEG